MLWQVRRGLIAGRGALDAAIGGGTPPSITYAGNGGFPGGVNTAIWTWSGVPLGTVGTNRRNFFMFMGSNTVAISSATIDGVSCDRIDTFGSAASSSIFILTAPTNTGNTSGSVVVTFAINTFNGLGFGQSWTLADKTTLGSLIPVTDYVAGGTSSTNGSVATLAGGFLIFGFNSVGLSGQSLTASTPTLTEDANFPNVGHLNALSAGTASATYGGYTGGPSGALLLAAYL